MADQQEPVLNGRRISDLRVTDLKRELETRGLAKGGNKKELYIRLREHLLAAQKTPQEDGDKGKERRSRRKTSASSSSSQSRSGSSSGSRSSSSSRSRSRSSHGRSSSSSSSSSGSSSSSRSRSSESSRSRSPESPPRRKMTIKIGSPPGQEAMMPRTEIIPSGINGEKEAEGGSPKDVEESSRDAEMREATPVEETPRVKMEVVTPVCTSEKSNSSEANAEVKEERESEEGEICDSREGSRLQVKGNIKQEEEEGECTSTQPSSPIKAEPHEDESKIEDKNDVKPKLPRKRRWGGRKVSPKRQISISSESLKGLIPDVKPILATDSPPCLAEENDEPTSEKEEENDENKRDMKIRRTVTQVVNSEDIREVHADESKERVEQPMEQAVSHEDHTEEKAPQIIRKISRKPLVTADEPTKSRRSPSPPRNPPGTVIHIWNLVRPFTLLQLKELLNRTGTIKEDVFWIDKIKSHCIVMYETKEQAMKTREALHGTKWPQSNPKILRVDFTSEAELLNHIDADKPIQREVQNDLGIKIRERREKEISERGQEALVKEKRPSGREWDREKIVQRSPTPPSRSRSGARERSLSRERKRRMKESREKERKEKKVEKRVYEEEPPAKLLDDLFRKTKATPSIYWLPLTETQSAEKDKQRRQRILAREKRRQEFEEGQEAERKRREMERLERRRKEAQQERERTKRRYSRSRSRSRSRGRRR